MTENFHLLLNVFVYFLNFSGIICMMFVFSINFNYFTMIDHMFKNWDMGIITDVQVINKLKSEKENVCPSEYDYLFGFTWPGTKLGCDCMGIRNMTNYQDFENKILIGPCSIPLAKYGCRTIPEIPGKIIHSFGDKYFCVKRSNFNYYANYSENVYEKVCPENMKSCGVIDSLNNIFCIKKSEKCPIQQKKFFTNISYINSEIPNEDSGEQNGIYLEINSITPDLTETNKTNSYSFQELPSLIKYYTKFFIQFGISQGNMCIDNDEVNLLNDEVYELYNNRKNMKCSTQLSSFNNFKYDYRYTPLMISETNLIYHKEDFIKKNIKELPNFPESYLYDPVTIYGRNYIGWSKKCKEYISDFTRSYKLALRIKDYSLFYLIYSMMMLIYCMLFVMILKELLYRKYFIKILIILVHVLMIAILFFYILQDYIDISNSVETCYIIVKKRCSDEETNRLIISVVDSFKSISDLFLITLILYVIIFLLSICTIMLIIYKIYKRKILNRVIQGEVSEFEMMLIL